MSIQSRLTDVRYELESYMSQPVSYTHLATIPKTELQKWVDYALEKGAVIIYDAAYEAYISEDNVAHTIYECDGADRCAIELRSFSKNAGFTGTRLGFTVIDVYKRQPHAIALTDYDEETDTFYCSDPAEGCAQARVPASDAIIELEDVDVVWYVTSPSKRCV